MRWSVIICTHNRCADLQETLPFLARLDYPADRFEVLVVDNASSDATPAVVDGVRRTIPNLRYVREEQVGLSHARNRGIAEAAGAFVAFMDDDAHPEPAWLAELEKAFGDAAVACVGGMVKPAWKTLAGWPDWLHERLRCFFTVLECTEPRAMHYPDYPAGTNIAFRRSVFAGIGGFNPALGRIGESLLSGEESDLCLRVERAGYRILYTPAAVVHHLVHEARLTREWVEQRSYWQGVSSAVIEKDAPPAGGLAAKLVKYALFIAAGSAGRVLFGIARAERLAFFCRCQVTLCKAYLKTLRERATDARGKSPLSPL